MRCEINEYSEHAVSTKKLTITDKRLYFYIFRLIFDHAYGLLDTPQRKTDIYQGGDG